MTNFERAWLSLLTIAMVGVFFYVLGTNDARRSQMMLEATVVHCDLGQIPVDCINNRAGNKRHKKSSKRNYIP